MPPTETITLFKTTGYNHKGEIRDLYWEIEKMNLTRKGFNTCECVFDMWAFLSPQIAIENKRENHIINQVITIIEEGIKLEDYVPNITSAINLLAEGHDLHGASPIEFDESGNEV